MKRLNLVISLVLIFSLLSLNSINCVAAEPYFVNLLDAELTTQEQLDMYNYYLGSDIVKSYINEINSYKYVIAICNADGANSTLSFYCFDDDVVMYKYFAEGDVLGVLSKAESIPLMYYCFRTDGTLNADDTLKVKFVSKREMMYETKHTFNDVTYCKSPHFYGVCGANKLVRCDVAVYLNANDACLALEGNDIKPLYYNTNSKVYYNGDDLYFKKFTAIPHVSNDYDSFYFEIRYELSDYAKAHLGDLNLRFDNQYTLDVDAFLGAINEQGTTEILSNSFPLDAYPNGFNLYIKDISSIQAFVVEVGSKGKQQVLGDELFIDTSVLSVSGLGGESFVKITGSRLYCQFYLRMSVDGKTYQGKRNDFNYDFLANKSEYDIWKSTDDSSSNGNLNYVKDGQTVTSNEYYYNDTTTNNDGTVVNNYYYYDSGGNRKKITADEYFNSNVNATASGGNASIGDINININNNMGQGGEYITISPVDFNQFARGVEELLKMFDTNGGLFLLLKDIFSMFPSDVSVIAVGAISAMTFVSIVCILRRR